MYNAFMGVYPTYTIQPRSIAMKIIKKGLAQGRGFYRYFKKLYTRIGSTNAPS